jgi:hypothetical protein
LHRNYYRCNPRLADEQARPEQTILSVYHQKAPHRNWQPAPKYLNLYDDDNFYPPANFFDDYEGRGRAAKEQEMEIDGHASWGHDFKLIVDPNGDTTDFYNDIKKMNPEQRANWMAAYESENQEFLAKNPMEKNWPLEIQPLHQRLPANHKIG